MISIYSSKSRYLFIFSFFLILLALASILSLCTGTISIPPARIFGILLGGEGGAFSVQEISIITKIRLPRLIMAGVLGGALSLSGFLLQTYFQNPPAGPSVIFLSFAARKPSTTEDNH